MNMKSYSWKSIDLSKPNNKINLYCRLMNSFGLFPAPLNKIAGIFEFAIKRKLKNPKIDFNYGCNVLFGNLLAGPVSLSNSYILDYAANIFGKGFLIRSDCKILTSWHPEEDLHTVNAKTIIFGDKVWLAMNVIVLEGVAFGSNAIIGARSIVTKSIPANVVAAGYPAKVIREMKNI